MNTRAALSWKPVDMTKNAALPSSWNHAVIHPEHYVRVRAFCTAVAEDGKAELVESFLDQLGASYQRTARFDPALWHARIFEDDLLHAATMHRFVDAISSLAVEFGALVSPLLWNTLASLGTRSDPGKEKSILEVKDELPYDWYLCDAALHGMGKAYALHFHVQSRIFAHTGTVLLHGCGCSHVLPDLGECEGLQFAFHLSPLKFIKAGQEFLDHFMSEVVLILLGYPFRMNPEHAQSVAALGFSELHHH